MGFKSKTTAVVASMFIVINAVGVQANTALTTNTASTICGSAFVGCVLPGATTKKAETVAKAPTPVAPAAVAEEKGGSGGLIIGALAVAAIVAGVLIASGGDDDDDVPASP